MKGISIKESEKFYKVSVNLILKHRIKEALENIRKLIIASSNSDLVSQFEFLDNTYKNLLKYAVEGAEDPERNSIYDKTRLSILELSDIARQQYLTSHSGDYTYSLKRKFENNIREVKTEIWSKLEDLNFNLELADLLEESS